jgi:hypothetical protein
MKGACPPDAQGDFLRGRSFHPARGAPQKSLPGAACSMKSKNPAPLVFPTQLRRSQPTPRLRHLPACALPSSRSAHSGPRQGFSRDRDSATFNFNVALSYLFTSLNSFQLCRCRTSL